jgi:hypothetical protein
VPYRAAFVSQRSVAALVPVVTPVAVMRLAGLQAAGAGGGAAHLRRLARGAAPTGCANPTSRDTQADAELTFSADHSMGADQMRVLPILAALGMTLAATACTYVRERPPPPPVVVLQPTPSTPPAVVVQP